jgi:hypothetical protein
MKKIEKKRENKMKIARGESSDETKKVPTCPIYYKKNIFGLWSMPVLDI